MSGYLIVNEINALTRRLYAEGYTRENHPDTVYWSDFQNLGYKWETMLGFTPDAILTHKTNHPHTKHLQASVWDVDPVKECEGCPVGLAWFSQIGRPHV